MPGALASIDGLPFTEHKRW